MNRNRIGTALGLGFVFALAAGPAAVYAGSTDDPAAHGDRGPQAESPVAATPEPGAPAAAQTGTAANEHANTLAKARLEAIMSRAKATPQPEAEPAEKGIMSEVKRVDAEAAAKGELNVSERLATEFGMTPDALKAERSQFQVGWGDLMIAHTLLANSKTTVTTEELFEMRSHGLGWGQIANGLGLKLGEVVRAAQAEGRVATGASKPDGKTARIESIGAHPAKGQSAAKSEAGAGPAAARGQNGSPSGQASQSGLGAAKSTPKGRSGK